MKKSLIVLVVLGLAFTFGFADEYDGINTAIDNLDGATQKTGGFGVRKFLQYFPLIMLVAGLGVGIFLGKQQANQQQDASKIAITILGVTIIGVLVGIATDAFAGWFLFRDGSKGLEIAAKEWLNAVGL
ncbi:TPA: hypothetical protein RPW20_000704 [Campylobacter fetus subsp. venerealis]|nr:hypothetical protein [Campylobacter fetus subsp. venerealis]